MKRSYLFAAILSLAGGAVLAQQSLETSAANTNSTELRSNTRISSLLIEDTKHYEDVIVRKDVEFSGPLVRPLKAKKLWEVPRRLLQLINPFAPTESREEWASSRGLSSRAWTSAVGWNPGRSAFPDAMTHEPTMGLISMGRASKP